MKKQLNVFLASVLVLSLLICPALAASSFPDVSDAANYAGAVEYLKDKGIMKGDEKGNFNPDARVTRAEMAVIICRLFGIASDVQKSEKFTDVPIDHWANAYIAEVAEYGIVNGYGGGLFGPNDTVTYEQALAMIIRAVGLDDYAEEQGGYPDGYILVAKEYWYTTDDLATKGEPLKRWQVATIAYNYDWRSGMGR